MALLACPFCRELFQPGERVSCPVCGVKLTNLEKLPASAHALHEDGLPHQPEWDPLPLTYLGRGRAVLAVCAVAGLAVFFAPWVHVTMPDIVSYSGFALARRLGWVWGAAVGWFVLVPTVITRRTIMHMRGARVAATFLSAVPAVTTSVLLARPPHGSHGVPLHFSFEWGLYATLALSAVAVGSALFFGGRVDDIAVRRGSSAGQVMH